jgi:hypothetical protein
MEIGLVLKFGKPVPGREQQALDLFAEAKGWIEEQYKEGVITYFEPYFYATGDLETESGFWVIKGEREKVWKWTGDERFLWFTAKAQFITEHFQMDWLTVGEQIPDRMELSAKIFTELAPVG